MIDYLGVVAIVLIEICTFIFFNVTEQLSGEVDCIH